jgi:hypothetical protein
MATASPLEPGRKVKRHQFVKIDHMKIEVCCLELASTRYSVPELSARLTAVVPQFRPVNCSYNINIFIFRPIWGNRAGRMKINLIEFYSLREILVRKSSYGWGWIANLIFFNWSYNINIFDLHVYLQYWLRLKTQLAPYFRYQPTYGITKLLPI